MQAADDSSSRPLVSIRCTVYNHEPYLRDCLRGFVMQQTDFPFEAIVHDDASTDGSAAIIREFAEKYPHIIKPIFQMENQYGKRDGSILRAIEAVMSPHSRYVALCEGDDYWTDPEKLQRQVAHLEADPACVMCVHESLVTWQGGQEPDSLYGTLEDRDYSLREIYAIQHFQTSSVVVRRSLYASGQYRQAAPLRRRYPFGDTIHYLTAASVGKVYGMHRVMSVYRRHEGGISYRWGADMSKVQLRQRFHREVPHYFGQELRQIAREHVAHGYQEMVLLAAAAGNYARALRLLVAFLRESPALALGFVFTTLRLRVLRQGR